MTIFYKIMKWCLYAWIIQCLTIHLITHFPVNKVRDLNCGLSYSMYRAELPFYHIPVVGFFIFLIPESYIVEISYEDTIKRIIIDVADDIALNEIHCIDNGDTIIAMYDDREIAIFLKSIYLNQ
jgi:hypothetical protein